MVLCRGYLSAGGPSSPPGLIFDPHEAVADTTQDELAETSIPDAGYAGTNAEIDMLMFDFDLFDYWDDLEYGYDHYWDYDGVRTTGEKRRRTEETKDTNGKRRKIDLKEMSGLTNIFIRMAERKKVWSQRAPVRKGLVPFALLPDWPKRCVEADMAQPVKTMPTEMRQAAEGKEEDEEDEDVLQGQQHAETDVAQDNEGDWEDDDGDELDDLQLSQNPDMVNVDYDALKTVLRQKLGDAGLTGVSEDSFMETMTKMLAGDGDADGATDDLANALLGTIEQGGNSGASGWLSQQGVSLDQAEDEGDESDADSVAAAKPREGSASASKPDKAKAIQVSPPDSAIEMTKVGGAARMAVRDGSPKTAKKRLASSTLGEHDEGTKRKKVVFDDASPLGPGATISSNNYDDNPEQEKQDEGTAGADLSTAEGKAASRAAPVPRPVKDTKASRGKTKAADPANIFATTDNQGDAKATKTRASKTKAEPAATAIAPAKQTRKRKTQPDEDDEPPPPSKRPTRRAAAADQNEVGEAQEDTKPSYARATRATRARSGK